MAVLDCRLLSGCAEADWPAARVWIGFFYFSFFDGECRVLRRIQACRSESSRLYAPVRNLFFSIDAGHAPEICNEKCENKSALGVVASSAARPTSPSSTIAIIQRRTTPTRLPSSCSTPRSTRTPMYPCMRASLIHNHTNADVSVHVRACTLACARVRVYAPWMVSAGLRL